MTLKELVALKGPVIDQVWECIGPMDYLAEFNGCGAVFEVDPQTKDCPVCKHGELFKYKLLNPNPNSL
jgi:rubrerythrin